MSHRIAWLNEHIVWGIPMVALLLGCSVFLVWHTRGLLFRQFPTVLRHTVGSLFKKSPDSDSITPFQAVCTALAGTVGTGNIVGVALAIAAGGPGALFWLWVSALLGMTLKYAEILLAVAYRTDSGANGPMQYLRRGLGSPLLAALFAVCGAVAACGIGAAVQANSLTVAVQSALPLPAPFIGVAVTALAAAVLVGGITRITRVASYLVPCMAAFYLIGAAIVLICYRRDIPAAFTAILRGAFTDTAAVGGFAGASARYACRIGLARGVFTHEAGMGSAPMAHALADTDHPARQGLWGAIEVTLDSLVLCTVTGLVILVTGVWQCDCSPATLTAAAFETAFEGGQYVVTVGLVLFAFATVTAWYSYGETCVRYLCPHHAWVWRLYRGLYLATVCGGCLIGTETLWECADLANGLMAVPNLIALVALSPVIRRLSDDFFADPHRKRAVNTSYHSFLTLKAKKERLTR